MESANKLLLLRQHLHNIKEQAGTQTSEFLNHLVDKYGYETPDPKTGEETKPKKVWIPHFTENNRQLSPL